MPQHEEIEIKAPLAEYEFDAGPDEPDADAVQAQALSRAMQGLARATSLDPDDGMDL
ncbi:hypothetical protein [Bradyrhizobium sp. 170]|uniref:hypothetical protein n=1 Tax=Bradyrhizobium sp. 170 TaxID=2782641 RepID=UPI001FFF49EA|nr:hypothetical protein [Bradyrhizobium sp. 170]